MASSPPIADLVALVRAATRGDTRSLEALLARVHPMLRRYAATTVGTHHDMASDIAQESLVRIVRGIHQLRADNESQIVAWCLAITRNLCIDWLRHLAIEPTHNASSSNFAYEAVPERRSDSAEESPRQMLFALVSACERELPDITRSILYLRLVEGAPWKEIGHSLELPATAAKRRFQRAQTTLLRSVMRSIERCGVPHREALLDQLRHFGVRV